MSYIINNSRGNIVAVVPDGTVNTTATSLALIGQGVTNYGTAQNENLVYLLENFANSSAPLTPVLGQLWYDSSTDQLYSYSTANTWILVASETYVQAQKISPAFTGIPTAPTAAAGTATTQLATTAFVTNSPQFSGVPRAPTANVGTANTQIATTAFVQNTLNSTGTMALQNANAVAITGGTITGLNSPLPVASGGTGAIVAAGARTNLGLGTVATQNAENIQVTGGSVTGLTTLSVADTTTGAVASVAGVFTPVSALPLSAGGTGSTTAAGARTNLGLGTAATANIGTLGLQNANAVAITGGTISDLATPLPVASGGTGGATAAAARTGIGAAQSGVNTDITQIAGLTSPLATVFGGTGKGTHTAGAVLVGAGTGNIDSISPGTAGNVLLSDGSAWVSAFLPTGTGTVTRVGLLAGNAISISGSPITTAGNITITNTGITQITTVSGAPMTGPITIQGNAVSRSGNVITISGAVGPAGATGPSGATGPQGASGPPGPGGGGDVYKAQNNTFTATNTFQGTTNLGVSNHSGAFGVSGYATFTGGVTVNTASGIPAAGHSGYLQIGATGPWGISKGTFEGTPGISIWYGSTTQGSFFSPSLIALGTTRTYTNGQFIAENNSVSALAAKTTNPSGGAGVQGDYSSATPGLGIGVLGIGSSSGFGGDILQASTPRSFSDQFDFIQGYAAGSPRFSVDGRGRFSTAYTGADYAEYFESVSRQQLTVGATVVLDGDLVREATDQDDVNDIIGVVRPKVDGRTTAFIGNEAELEWNQRYVTDEFGRYVKETHHIIEWNEKIGPETKLHSYESHRVPDHVVIPDHAETKTHDDNGVAYSHWKEHPNFDPDAVYVPRSKRDEWNVIGLMGQVPVLKGQPVNPAWRRMKDISATVELWFIR